MSSSQDTNDQWPASRFTVPFWSPAPTKAPCGSGPLVPPEASNAMDSRSPILRVGCQDGLVSGSGAVCCDIIEELQVAGWTNQAPGSQIQLAWRSSNSSNPYTPSALLPQIHNSLIIQPIILYVVWAIIPTASLAPQTKNNIQCSNQWLQANTT